MNMSVECLKINQQCLYSTLNQLLFYFSEMYNEQDNSDTDT